MRNMHYEALSHLYEAANKVSTDEFDGEELDIALNHALSALSLPTANHIPDAGKMVETAAPVDERTAFEALFRERYGWDAKDFKRDSRGDYMDGNTVTAWMSWQARAALQSSADVRDAVLAERDACAKVCERIDLEYEGEDVQATWCAAAIRARSNT